MEFIKSKKIDLEGKLLVSIPSEGCLGQRVVDQILTNNKCLEFVGSFHHSSLQVKSCLILITICISKLMKRSINRK